MSRPSISTPCPAPLGGSSLRRLSIASLPAADGATEDTLELDYTRAIPQQHITAKPRRRTSLNRRVEKIAPVTIFEDVPEDGELVVSKTEVPDKKTLLGKPARKIPHRTVQERVPAGSGPLRDVGQARRHSVLPSQEQPPAEQAAVEGRLSRPNGNDVAKAPRRRTIFIPNEDTTILTIHPGAHNSDWLNDTFHLPTFSTSPPITKESQLRANKPVKGRRRSLAAAPRRAPLGERTDSPQNVGAFDIAGPNTGKENFPPSQHSQIVTKQGKLDPLVQSNDKFAPPVTTASYVAAEAHQGSTTQVTKLSTDRRISLPRRQSNVPPNRHAHVREAVTAKREQARPISEDGGRLYPDKQSREAQHTSNVVRGDIRVSPNNNNTLLDGRTVVQKANIAPQHPSHPRHTAPLHAQNDPNSAERRQQLRNFITSKRNEQHLAEVQKYPVLCENLHHTELYEDSWLSRQEIGLTEVINEIFANAEVKKFQASRAPTSLRQQLITIYHQPNVTIIYKHLQASFQYGALSRPKDSSSTIILNNDIGLRKSFLSLWLDNYEDEILRAAVEVVVGRQIPTQTGTPIDHVGNIEQLLDPHANRRRLVKFIETFLVSAGDIELFEGPDAAEEIEEARWKKTMLRSLMLVWLMDNAKQSGILTGRLFKRSATNKSSASVLQALCKMLIPSIGDYVRVLRYKDYEVGHVQEPLDEVVYSIQNLAVDLRDGILLTRLAELVLYTPTTTTVKSSLGEAEVTICLPDATVLESTLLADDGVHVAPYILSRHLKIPCIGHVQKTYNVQLALSAIADSGLRGANIVGDIAAADIVNGHREKTLNLLWSLVSNYGLRSLVDWHALVSDIKRLDASKITPICLDGFEDLARDTQEELLETWASTHAAVYEVRVNNLTTSFADGRVYNAIVEAFSAYLPATSTGKHSVRSGLRSLGCSEAFTNQIASHFGILPSRETTLSNLAFLASRLLPLARHYHAANTIQRAYRLRRARAAITSRVVLMRLAHACAVVAAARHREVNAATTLQRAWRAVLDARIARLEEDVRIFQVVAKGWLGRNAGRKDIRVFGGW